MSYATLAGVLDCLDDETWDAETQQCIPLYCPQGFVNYHGTCLSPEDQKVLGPELCRSDEVWSDADMGCACKPGTTRGGVYGGSCRPLQQGEVQTSADVRTASVGVSPLRVLALATVLATGGALAYYYYS